MTDTITPSIDQAVTVLEKALTEWNHYALGNAESVTWRHRDRKWVVVAYTSGERYGLVRVTYLDRLSRRRRERVLSEPIPVELPKLLNDLGAPDVHHPGHQAKVEVAA